MLERQSVTEAPAAATAPVVDEANAVALKDLDGSPVSTESTPVEAAAPDADEAADAAALETAPAAKPDKLASKFAALARRERALVDREKSINEQLKGLDAWERAKKEASDDPGAALESLGLTYEKVTDWILADRPKKDPTVKNLEERLATVEKREAEAKAQAEQLAKQAHIDNFKRDQIDAVKSAGDKYELVNQLGRHDLVFEVTQEYIQTHKRIPSHDEAAQMVEDYLLSEVTKFKGVKKLAALFGSQDASTIKAPAKSDPNTPDSGSKNQPKTLTNTLSDAAPEPGDDPDKLSDEESKARAARLIRFI